MDVRFLTDRSLGRLSKWLRLLGYDTVYYRGEADRAFLRKAEKEGRVVITRKRDLAGRSHPGPIVVLREDLVEDQIREVLSRLSLQPDPASLFRRCLLCNDDLEDVGPDRAAGLVPEYVWGQVRDFRRCPRCGKIYWPGTHRDRALQFLRTHIPGHFP
jgi:hypothetical protein